MIPFVLQKTESSTVISSEAHYSCQILWYAKGDSLGTQKWKHQITRDLGLELDSVWHFETQALEFMDIQWCKKDKSWSVGALAQ